MNQANIQSLTVGVQGMTCASCVGSVEKAVSQLDGVSAVSVNLATEKATVTLDPGKANSTTVLDAIRESGFKPVTAHASIGVQGMTCASCVGSVEQALRKLDGVVEANVNLATERASIEYLPDNVTHGNLKGAIRGAGYEVIEEEAGKDRVDIEREAREKELSDVRRSVIISAAFTIPLFLLVMVPMVIPALDAWLQSVIPMQVILYISFVLATVVQFGPGMRVMRSGWQALISGRPDMNS